MEMKAMLTRRWLIGVLAVVWTAAPLGAQGVMLSEAPLEKRCVRNELTLELKGKQTVKQNKKDMEFPLHLEARHTFVERYLQISGAVADQAARFYTTAESTIRFNNDEGTRRALSSRHNFLVTQRLKDQLVTFSPRDRLSRDEIELMDHFDTMTVSGMLPGKQVAIGQSWQLPNHVVQALCALQG